MTFGIYLHVPFCASRCGYCDFNTYTPGELGMGPEPYLEALAIELELAAERTGDRLVDTVFVGGGTPSMLGSVGLTRVLDAVTANFRLKTGAEITTESNPESTSPEFFVALKEAGFTRISLGMQSAAPHVLRVLERKHTPGRAVAAAKEARAAGFEHVNLDMIYGTPGETDDDVRRTVEAILSADVDHVSAYSLIVEDGTAMARKVRKGELPAPDEDVLADRYEIIDNMLDGYDWYEVSNWAKPGGECQHNLGYWRNGDWWGAGPGAHSHIDGTRFYNVKHPRRYNDTLSRAELPIKECEVLTEEDIRTERVMLGLRLKEGIPAQWVDAPLAVDKHVRAGLLTAGERLAVTDRGRLLADGIIADLLVGV
ncbi:coproporphyrinogen III oxidase [Corynebacterium hindlerae]|uniref:Heme chaperone HemW n=1 Tax=Corynebacterium hindlerae TaxID=699041 RepID=A0A7G5FE74_9CORY|nr:radical SAM family heme chaperone HemW [Corynebacterium hindlerae]QMV84915.1 coproporphyrinogen III oxidase [Corynebacterium hindlerae]